MAGVRRMFKVRASSLGELFDCPARWEAKYVLGMKGMNNGKAQLGTAIHAGTAAYDQAKLDGRPISVNEALAPMVESIWRPGYEVDWGDDTPKLAEQIGGKLVHMYAKDIAPKLEFAAVEVTCEALEITDLGITLTGTADRIRVVDGQYGVSDLKSGGRAVGTDGVAVTAGHAPQLAVYELLAEHTFGKRMSLPVQVIGLQTQKTTPRVGLGEIENVREMLVGDDDEPGLLRYAAHLIRTGTFYGNSKSMLCSPKFCPRYKTCKYKG